MLDKLLEELQEVDIWLTELAKNKSMKRPLQEESNDLDRYGDSIARRTSGRQNEMGFIPGDLIDYIVSQNNPCKRTDLLTLLSRQAYTQAPHPTILLILAVSDVFTAPGS